MYKRNNNLHVSRKKSKSGFTLVELIVVIVVLGILAAIGIPRYNDYVNDGRLAHIKADMKTISSLIEVTAMDDDGIYRGDFVDDLSELEKAISEGRAYKEGNLLLQEDYAGGDFHVIKELFIKSNARSKLKGSFLVDENDDVYYIADRNLKGKDIAKEDKPFTDKEIDDLIALGYIPVSSADELQQINDTGGDTKTWGAGTKWEMNHVGGLEEKYIQVNDIDLSSYDNWVPIGLNPGIPFKGAYDGGDFTLSNLNITSVNGSYSGGLFGSIVGDVILKNINIDNINVSESYRFVGGLVGDSGSSGATSLIISNVKISNAGLVGNNNNSNIGGLIGYNLGALKINKISFSGDLIGHVVGGVVAGSHISGDNEDIESIEKATITGNFTGSNDVGGLIGSISSTIGVIKDISYEGDLEGCDVGGLIAKYDGGSINDIESITIKGNFTGSKGVGGLIGSIASTIGNIKDISYEGDLEGYDVGGLIAKHNGGSINDIESITIKGNFTGSEDVGGLIGSITSTIGNIKDISYEGDLEGSDVGGLIAKYNGAGIERIEVVVVKGNFNGQINAGGLLGRTATTTGNINNVEYQGSLKGENTGGLIANDNGSLATTIENIKINNSRIEGTRYAGGLIGFKVGEINLKGIEVKGSDMSSGNHAGGIIGFMPVGDISILGMSIVNSDIVGNFNVGGIAGVHYEQKDFKDINISGTISGDSDSDFEQGTGGLIGESKGSISMDNVKVSSEIKGSNNIGSVFGVSDVDIDLTGFNFAGTISGTGINVGGGIGLIKD